MLCSILLVVGHSFAADSIPVQARKLIGQRDVLQQQLLQADQDAVDAILTGTDPLELHATQTGLQDQVDVLQMHLESLALRFDFSLPDLSQSIDSGNPGELLEPHIVTGRERADRVIRNRCRIECRDMLMQIRFDDFLDF